MGPTLGAHLWTRDAASTRARAAQLEALGFASVTVGDHLGHYPPLTACAVIASATSRIRFGPLVLNNDFRHPVVLAHEAAALAELSGGRFELGLGAGYARREYERAGIPFLPRLARTARLAESTRILRALFAGETVTFAGEHYDVREQALPLLRHRVPLLIGGNSPERHAVAGEHADIVGLTGSARSREADTSDYASSAVERQVRRLRELAGPRFERLELQVLVQWHEVTSERGGAGERAAASLGVPVDVALSSPYALVGTPDEIATQLADQHVRLGIRRWTILRTDPTCKRPSRSSRS